MAARTLKRAEAIAALWQLGDLSWKLHKTQLKIDAAVKASSETEILVLSARQLGKSYWAVCYAIEYCLRNPGVIVRILAPTLKQVSDIVADNLERIIADAPPGLIHRHKSSYRWHVGTSSLRLGSLEKAHVNGNRGGNASLVIAEEAGFVPSDDYVYGIQSVIGPQLLRSGGRLIHVTSPSVDPTHYIHEVVLPKCKLAGASFRYTIYDNPQITEEQIEQAKRLCGGEDTVAWQREYLAEIKRPETEVIVPRFDVKRHVVASDVPSYARWTLSLDAGGARDMHAVTLSYYDYRRAKTVYRRSLSWPPGTNTDVVIAACKELEEELELTEFDDHGRITEEKAKVWRIADAPPLLLLDIAKLYHYNFVLPSKDNRDAAINVFDIGFANDEIEVHPDCEHLILTLESGRWNGQRTDFVRTKALGHCDSLMAAVYGYRHIDKSNPLPERREVGLRVKPKKASTGEERLAELFGRTRPRGF